MKCPFVIKQCSKCKRLLVANKTNFHKGDGKFGLQAKCKKCRKEYRDKHKEHNKEYQKKYRENHKIKANEYSRQYYQDNKESLKEYQKIYRKKNKEIRSKNRKKYYQDNKEESLRVNKIYRENNKEKIKKYNRQYYQENKESIKERCKKYYQNNPHITFNSHVKRRQLKENQGNGIAKEQWLEMMNYFDWCCAYSGEYLGGNSEHRTIDHIVPLSRNGEHEPWNCVPCYDNYNYSKHNKDFIDWYLDQDFFDIDRLLKIYEWIEYAYKKWN